MNNIELLARRIDDAISTVLGAPRAYGHILFTLAQEWHYTGGLDAGSRDDLRAARDHVDQVVEDMLDAPDVLASMAEGLEASIAYVTR